MQQSTGHGERVVGFHRAVTGVVVEVGLPALGLHALFHQVFVDVQQAAVREDALELVLQQLIHAGAAGDDDRADVQIVEGGGQAVEQHPVAGGDFLPLLCEAIGPLRIATAEIARWQHGLHAQIKQGGQGGQADFAVDAFRAAAGEVEHRFGIRFRVGTAQDGYLGFVLDVQQAAQGGPGDGQFHRLLHQFDGLARQRGRTGGVGRTLAGLAQQARGPKQAVTGVERRQAPLDQWLAQAADQPGLVAVEQGHGRLAEQAAALLAAFVQYFAHAHADIAEVDVHRAGVEAFVADGAVVGHIAQGVEVVQGDAATGLLLVEKGLDEQAGGENLVARRVEQIGFRHMGHAHRLALAAAQAVLDVVVEGAQLAVFENERFLFQQLQRGGVGAFQPGAGHELAGVEALCRVHAVLVAHKGLQFVLFQVLDLGQANAVLAGDDAVQLLRQRHDGVHQFLGPAHHGRVLRMHRDIGVHIAVTGVHVQGDEQPFITNALVNGAQFLAQGLELFAGEGLVQQLNDFPPVGDDDLPPEQEVQQGVAGAGFAFAQAEAVGELFRRFIQVLQQVFPAGGPLAHVPDQLVDLLQQDFPLLAGFPRVQPAGLFQPVADGLDDAQLVADGFDDVQPLHAPVVGRQVLQWNDHILVDLEGVGMGGDGGGTGAVQPETLAGLGADGDEAFAAALIGQAHDMAGGQPQRGLVIADEVGQQHHLGSLLSGGLGGVAHGLEVAVVQVLQPGQAHGRVGFHIAGDGEYGFHRRGHFRVEEFQADGTHMGGHAMENEAGGGDQPVATFLLHTRQAGEELVSDILAQTVLAEGLAGNFQPFRLAPAGFAIGFVVVDFKHHPFLLVNFPQVVADTHHFQPVAVGHDHAPGSEIVQGGAPEHGLLAAGVHGDIAADGGSILRGGIDGEGQLVLLGQIGNPAGDHAAFCPYRGHGFFHAGQGSFFHRPQADEFFGVDHRRKPGQGHGGAGVAGAATTGNDVQLQLGQRLYQRGYFRFRFRVDHHEGHFHPPVGGVGGVADPCGAGEVDIVLAGDAFQSLADLAPQGGVIPQLRGKLLHGIAGDFQKTQGPGVGMSTLFELLQPVFQRLYQQLPALAVVDEIVLQKGVAADHPEIPQHLEQHACRTAGAAAVAQGLNELPAFLAEKATDDVAVGEGSVVVGDLPNAMGHGFSSSAVVRPGWTVYPQASARAP